MPQPSRFVLLTLVAAAALAAPDPPLTVASAASPDRRVAERRPRLEAAEPPGGAIDCNPIPAYPAPERGPRQTIAGRCFVVTDGGQVIEFEGVRVGVYPQREFSWYAQEIQARSRARFQQVRSVVFPENFAALSLPEMDRSLTVAAELQRDLHRVWQALPAASASAPTDAVGRFSVTHEVAPPYVVFAVGSRRVGDGTEYYRWQVGSNQFGDPLQIVLGNDAL